MENFDATDFLNELKEYYEFFKGYPKGTLLENCPICGVYDPDLSFPRLPNELFCPRCECCWGPYSHGKINQKTVQYILFGDKNKRIDKTYSIEEIITIGLETQRIRKHLLFSEALSGHINIKEIIEKMQRYGAVGSMGRGCLSTILMITTTVIVLCVFSIILIK